jgi:hypothetical protein
MVDVEEVKQLIGRYFHIQGTYIIDPITGIVDVTGHVILKRKLLTRLPVRFGKILNGDFHVDECTLETLEGSPTSVDGDFECAYNQLKNLQGAPKHVGNDMYFQGNPLTSLDGYPEKIDGGVMLTWDKDLPLLRLLQTEKILFTNAPKEVNHILNKYAGTGKKGMLGAAAELTKAGFRDNARW